MSEKRDVTALDNDVEHYFGVTATVYVLVKLPEGTDERKVTDRAAHLIEDGHGTVQFTTIDEEWDE
jgi:hypothetical protein